VTVKPIPLSARVPGKQFPPLLDQVIDRALAKKPEDRFSSSAEFGAAMQAVLEGRTELPKVPADAAATVKMPPLDLSGDAGHVSSKPASHARSQSSSAPARPRLSWGMLAAIAAVCLVIGAVLTVLAMKLTMR
jgi:serine/threonine-protein kinase